jgi:hypothetical protein
MKIRFLCVGLVLLAVGCTVLTHLRTRDLPLRKAQSLLTRRANT